MRGKILPVVVLYNEKYLCTPVYKTLLNYMGNVPVVVYENSPIQCNVDLPSENIYYNYDQNNGGVSAAYNYGAKIARERGDIEALLLLDQDSQFVSDYVSLLEKHLQANPRVDLFVPKVLYKINRPFSPIRRRLLKRVGRGVLQEGEYSLNDYLPVNSGACVRLMAFERVHGYNGWIRLDFADFDFFSRLCAVSPDFYLVDSVVHQHFSNEEREVDQLFFRYKLYVEGAYYAVMNKSIRRFVIADVLKHTFGLTLKTYSIRFLWYLICNFRC